jgi:hypothetical protein
LTNHRYCHLFSAFASARLTQKCGWAQDVALHSVSIIFMNNATQNIAAMDWSGLRTSCWRQRWLLSQTMVRTGRVVMVGVVSQDMSQVQLIGHEQVIQAFLPSTAQPAFGNSIGIGLQGQKTTSAIVNSAMFVARIRLTDIPLTISNYRQTTGC